MGYFEVLITIIVLIVLILHVRMCKDRKKVLFLFCLYILTVLVITLFTRDYDLDKHPMLNPLSKYHLVAKRIANSTIKNGGNGLWKAVTINESIITELLLNILLFVPLGLFVPKISTFFQRWWRVVLLGLVSSATIELLQLVTHLGCFETVDLVNNTLGAWIGYWLFCMFIGRSGIACSVSHD